MEQSHATECFTGEFFRIQRPVIKHNENPPRKATAAQGGFHLIGSMNCNLSPGS